MRTVKPFGSLLTVRFFSIALTSCDHAGVESQRTAAAAAKSETRRYMLRSPVDMVRNPILRHLSYDEAMLLRPPPRFTGLPREGFSAFSVPDREERRRAIIAAFHPALKLLAEDILA